MGQTCCITVLSSRLKACDLFHRNLNHVHVIFVMCSCLFNVFAVSNGWFHNFSKMLPKAYVTSLKKYSKGWIAVLLFYYFPYGASKNHLAFLHFLLRFELKWVQILLSNLQTKVYNISVHRKMEVDHIRAQHPTKIPVSNFASCIPA